MTIHSSLKTKSGALSQHRNVLTRAERIEKLASQEKFIKDKNSPLGVVKVRNILVSAGKKKKAEGEAATPAAGAAPGAAAPAAGAAAKPGAPAAAAAKPGAKAPAAAAGAKPAGDAKKK
ncbi:MAG: small basic protein [Phycisphaerales bacterium]